MFTNPFFTIVTAIIGVLVLLALFKNYTFLIVAPFYEVQEMLRFIRVTKKLQKEQKRKNVYFSPKVSVIIPAWNEEVGIVKTISSVVENGYRNLEVIVVDDGSTDNTRKVVKKYLRENKVKIVKYIHQKNGGKGVALNTGISYVTGDIVLTVDADSKLEKGAIEKLVKYYRDEEIMAVVGNVKVINTSTLIGLAQHLEYYFGFYNKRTHAVLGAEYIFGGACASFRTEVFDKIGLFDTQNKTEDIEMSMRVRYYGYKCTYAEDVVCYTEGASTVTGLLAQRVRWKKGRLDTFIKYKSLFFSVEDEHNFFLSFFVLPLSVISEIQMLIEPIALTILMVYSLVTMESVSFALGLIFIFLIYVVTAIFSNKRIRLDLLALFPFTWPLFYFLEWVEFASLIKSVRMLVKKEDVVWQTWKRQGI